MNLNDILCAKTLDTEPLTELFGVYYNHLPDIEEYPLEFNNYDFGKLKDTGLLLENKFYLEGICGRYTSVNVLTLNGKDVMVTRNGGRDGDDFFDRFIIDKNLYLKVRELILACKNPREEVEIETHKIFREIENLDLIKGQKVYLKDNI